MFLRKIKIPVFFAVAAYLIFLSLTAGIPPLNKTEKKYPLVEKPTSEISRKAAIPVQSDTSLIQERKVNQFLPMKKCDGYQNAETGEKVVALTFDDGPFNKYTGKILEILKEHNVKATFFLVGEYVTYYPVLTKKIHKQGHVLGNHSFSHPDFKKITTDEMKKELNKTSREIKKVTGKYPLLFRPPYGHCTDSVNHTVNHLGYTIITWSVMTDDFCPDAKAVKIKEDILDKVHPGAIIGLHDGGGDRTKTLKALPGIIEEIREQGYEFLTIPELLNIEPYK